MPQAFRDLLGFPVDGYVLVDLEAFQKTVDLVRGVEFDVPMDMNYEDPSQNLYIHLQKGLQTLDGEQAMGLVRFRKGYATQDIQRTQTQQQFLKALAKAVPVRQQPDEAQGIRGYLLPIRHHEPHDRQHGLVRQGTAQLRF